MYPNGTSELLEKELSLEEMQQAHDEMIKGLEFEVDERKFWESDQAKEGVKR